LGNFHEEEAGEGKRRELVTTLSPYFPVLIFDLLFCLSYLSHFPLSLLEAIWTLLSCPRSRNVSTENKETDFVSSFLFTNNKEHAVAHSPLPRAKWPAKGRHEEYEEQEEGRGKRAGARGR